MSNRDCEARHRQLFHQSLHQHTGINPIDDELMDNNDTWLRQTKIIGLDGEPLVLYHGTNKLFSEFKPSKSGAQGPGIYMSDAPAEYGQITLKLHVRMLNPFFFYPSDESLESEINGELIEQVLSPELSKIVFERIDMEGYESYGAEVQDTLKAMGYDGIVMVYPFGEPTIRGQSGAAVVIAFDPSQVRILPAPERTAARRHHHRYSDSSPSPY